MSAFEIQDVMNYLKQRFIVISLEWVEACISFVKQEYNNQNLPANVLKDYVYQQWLNADLEEIGVSALPNELTTIQKVTLTGSFALQVNGVRDVGKPAYAQLKELDRNRSFNEEFSTSGPDAPPPPWEAKPTRMLMLNLTDGCTTVQGMEYKPLSNISINLTPGVKVLIKGPVDCRFGVFLLKAENINVLGGEVESKLEQYSQTAILKEILHLPSDENNPNDTESSANTQDSDSISIISATGNLRQTTISSAFSQQSTVNLELNNNQRGNYEQNYSLNNRRGGATDHTANSYPTRNQINNPDLETVNLDDFDNDDDDFAQSLDYDAIDELEKENSLTQIDVPEEENIWNEDEDVLQDMMAFQDENQGFSIPDEMNIYENTNPKDSGIRRDKPFTYLSAVTNEQHSELSITVKGFIIRVLSKLECTVDKGWNLCVKINDGTATLDASVHDKVLENIIGVSAVEMVKMQKEAAHDVEKRKKAMEAISKCKTSLQNYNGLIDIKFIPNVKPCIMKFHPVTYVHLKQLMERTRIYFK